MLQLGHSYQGATDQRIMDDGTIIRFTDDSQFEIIFPDGHQEIWDPIASTRTAVKKQSMQKYLFAYFNNNTTEGQQVCYAVSDDGVNFKPL